MGDLIVSGGENVRPQRGRGGDAEPTPASPTWRWRGGRIGSGGQVVVAFVVGSTGETPTESEPDRGHGRERLAVHEVPKRVEFVEELPRTGSGKLCGRLLIEPEPSDL